MKMNEEPADDKVDWGRITFWQWFFSYFWVFVAIVFLVFAYWITVLMR